MNKSTIEKIKGFEKHLRMKDLSSNTICGYVFTVEYFFTNYPKMNKENLLDYKSYLIDNFKPNTINQRVSALSHYIDYQELDPRLKLKPVKVQNKMFLENVISNTDYEFLKNKLLEDGNMSWYYIVWTLGATGARISEFLQLKYEHFQEGHFDIYSKGGKYRRLYIPKKLAKSLLEWTNKTGIKQGYIFLNRNKKLYTSRGIAVGLKELGKRYKINTKLMYPHSFRHLFAKNFLKKKEDIAFLADLMGHESIDTTRIYLRKTSEEQRALVDKIITW